VSGTLNINDLMAIDDVRRRVNKRRSWVINFAKSTGTLHQPTHKIVWPEFEAAFMASRERAEQLTEIRQVMRKAKEAAPAPKSSRVTC
jgi:hypothetical protein